MAVEQTNDRLIGVIPAAGKGTRMLPLTERTPKALVYVEKKTLLEIAIENLITAGVTEIVVVIGHYSQQIQEFIDRTTFCVPISVVHQGKQQGLPHAIACARRFLLADFVVYCPDNIYSSPEDFRIARNAFFKNRPMVLQTSTVVPSENRNRTTYRTSDYENIEPNLFRLKNLGLSSGTALSEGLPLYPTGITFLAKEALTKLPVFDDATEEYHFKDFLDVLSASAPFHLYLMRGTRYDLTTEQDVAHYCDHQQRLVNTLSSGVSAVLLDPKGRVLLQQRDDKPGISYPGYWGLFGGTVEAGETADDAVIREIKEELGYDLRNLGLFRDYIHKAKHEFAFVSALDAEISSLQLTEGRNMKIFEPSELDALNIRPDDRETLNSYFGKK